MYRLTGETMEKPKSANPKILISGCGISYGVGELPTWVKVLKIAGLDIKDLTGLPKKVTQRLHYLPPSKDRWKLRSTTYKGIAQAMASQWG